jgi:glutaminyl-tRNA synthetase
MTQNNEPSDFIREIVKQDLINNKWGGSTVTRFPPEPNGFLHIGHATSICLNFGIAEETGGRCHLRFDDTNPTKEDQRYVDSIIRDITWLGWSWNQHLYYASDYFDELYQFAVTLIENGKAYIDDQTPEAIRIDRGTLTEGGTESPYRNRSIKENLDLFERMKNGEFEEGEKVLRAKIDMSSGNLNFRDPVLYRILKSEHHRTLDKWCIYPMYDFAHGQSDSIEHITHSICTLEFEDHRPLYDWFIKELGLHHPQQIEFARLNLTYTVLSKRKLSQLVQENFVEGWDDPRMPTLSGLRRRGFTPESIKEFCRLVGVSKRPKTIELAVLEHSLRKGLNLTAPRVMGVLRPLKLIIDNYPTNDNIEYLEATNNPEDASKGTRLVPFGRELYIEKADFSDNPPSKFNRLAIDREVRLRYGYFVTCTDFTKDPISGEITEVHCTYDPETKGGYAPDGRKVRGTIHWVSATQAIDAEVRLYGTLFTAEKPDESDDFRTIINQDSLEVLRNCKIEPSVLTSNEQTTYQFERLGYFTMDTESPGQEMPLFHRSVTLRDTWSK